MIYAGFWRRLGALLLDLIIQLPILGIYYWGGTHYRLFYPYSLLPSLLFSLFYNIYLVHRLGGTPGKKLAGIVICKPDGSDIGYRDAVLRYLPELVMTTLLSIGYVYVALGLTDSEYAALSMRDKFAQFSASAPFWYQPLNTIYTVWIWGELLVMLTNKKRRALHDFIAGTVVIIRNPWILQPGSPSEALFADRLKRMSS